LQELCTVELSTVWIKPTTSLVSIVAFGAFGMVAAIAERVTEI
jgi:hypothetical protein